MELILNLLSNMAFVAIIAYLVGRNKRFIQYIQNIHPFRLNWGMFWLTLIFSLVAVIGTYNGFAIEGGLANTRISGVLIGGFMGGPVVGGCVGVISGLHRYWLGGFTAFSCGVSAVIVGLLAGIIRQRIGLYGLNWKVGAITTLAAEGVQKILTLLLAKPFAAAWALERAIAIPTTLTSIIGTIIFIVILNDLRSVQDRHSAKAAELSLEIATQTLPYLRKGLYRESAQKTAEIIYRLTNVSAVVIADCERILGAAGDNDCHSQNGKNFLAGPDFTENTLQTLNEKTVAIITMENEKGRKLKTGVIGQLEINGSVAGSIKLCRKEGISEADICIAAGIAHLLSVQIQLAETDKQRKMRENAEWKTLQAQINPHFLFNTLNIIMSFCRTAPDMARQLLEHLSIILERSFANNQDFVSLAEELAGIEAYLHIAQARFGERLAVSMHIEPEALLGTVPFLSIQPIVENAILHGLFPKLKDCELRINAVKKGNIITVAVIDNGIGIEEKYLHALFDGKQEGIGLKNVHDRLVSLYGEGHGLQVTSAMGAGTTVIFNIPYQENRSVVA